MQGGRREVRMHLKTAHSFTPHSPPSHTFPLPLPPLHLTPPKPRISTKAEPLTRPANPSLPIPPQKKNNIKQKKCPLPISPPFLPLPTTHLGITGNTRVAQNSQVTQKTQSST
eukprot:Sspe_Gene.23724::Locus_9268_Transcript_1_1_Confidence_1.000_Length_2098::g.23724::m.23724